MVDGVNDVLGYSGRCLRDGAQPQVHRQSIIKSVTAQTARYCSCWRTAGRPEGSYSLSPDDFGTHVSPALSLLLTTSISRRGLCRGLLIASPAVDFPRYAARRLSRNAPCVGESFVGNERCDGTVAKCRFEFVPPRHRSGVRQQRQGVKIGACPSKTSNTRTV